MCCPGLQLAAATHAQPLASIGSCKCLHHPLSLSHILIQNHKQLGHLPVASCNRRLGSSGSPSHARAHTNRCASCRLATCPPTGSRTRTCSSSRGQSRPPGVLSKPPSLLPGLPWAHQRPDPQEGVEDQWAPHPPGWEPWDRRPPAQVSSTAHVAAVLIRLWGG